MKNRWLLSLFRSNKKNKKRRPNLMLFMPRTCRKPRRRPWKCSRVPKMRPNRLLGRAFLRLFLHIVLRRSQSNRVKVGDSLVALLIKSRNLRKVRKLRSKKPSKRRKRLH